MKQQSLQKALLALRYSVFLVMFMWTIDKFINPVHASKVFAHFYFFDGLSVNLAYIVGAVQMALILAFLVGFKKRISYGAVLVMHGISTFSSFAMYLDPWGPRNLLFFAAWPMLAAIYSLYVLRDEDSLLTIKK